MPARSTTLLAQFVDPGRGSRTPANRRASERTASDSAGSFRSRAPPCVAATRGSPNTGPTTVDDRRPRSSSAVTRIVTSGVEGRPRRRTAGGEALSRRRAAGRRKHECAAFRARRCPRRGRSSPHAKRARRARAAEGPLWKAAPVLAAAGATPCAPRVVVLDNRYFERRRLVAVAQAELHLEPVAAPDRCLPGKKIVHACTHLRRT